MPKQVLGKVLCNPKKKQKNKSCALLPLPFSSRWLDPVITDKFLEINLVFILQSIKKANLVGGEQILQTKFPSDITN